MTVTAKGRRLKRDLRTMILPGEFREALETVAPGSVPPPTPSSSLGELINAAVPVLAAAPDYDTDLARSLSASYHRTVASPVKLIEVVEHAAPIMRRWLVENTKTAQITHMAVSGISGMSVGFPLSMQLNLPIMMVRKRGEQAHTGMLVGEGVLGDYIILDDLIASGATIQRILDDVVATQLVRHLDYGHPAETFAPPICRGIFLHHNDTPWNAVREEFTPVRWVGDKAVRSGVERGRDLAAFDGYKFTHPTIPVIDVERH